METIQVPCYWCDGNGEKDYGWVAEGIYPNVETYYKGIDVCDVCEGEKFNQRIIMD